LVNEALKDNTCYEEEFRIKEDQSLKVLAKDLKSLKSEVAELHQFIEKCESNKKNINADDSNAIS
jgi:phage shock protein A